MVNFLFSTHTHTSRVLHFDYKMSEGSDVDLEDGELLSSDEEEPGDKVQLGEHYSPNTEELCSIFSNTSWKWLSFDRVHSILATQFCWPCAFLLSQHVCALLLTCKVSHKDNFLVCCACHLVFIIVRICHALAVFT